MENSKSNQNLKIIWESLRLCQWHQLVMWAQFKCLHLWWYEGALEPMPIWKGHHHCCHPDHIFFRPCIFQQDNAKPHTVCLTTVWLCLRRGQELDCSTNLSPIKNIKCIMKHYIQQRRPRTVEQLKSYQKRLGQHSSPKGPTAGLLSSQVFTDCS